MLFCDKQSFMQNDIPCSTLSPVPMIQHNTKYIIHYCSTTKTLQRVEWTSKSFRNGAAKTAPLVLRS